MAKALDPLVSLQPPFPKLYPDAAARVLYVLEQIQSFERMVPERQNELLSGQLNHLLQHAKQYTPFWGERLSNWAPRDGSPTDTLRDVAPLTRKDLQSEFARLSARFPQRQALGVKESSSSGSTGTPVRFERSPLLYAPVYYAVMMQCANWHNIDQTKPFGVVGSKHQDKENVPLGIPYVWFGPVAKGFERSTRGREISDIFNYCAARKPAYLQCGPTLLTSLARYAIDNGRDDLRPDAALTLGSAVTDDIREIVRKGLGTKIIDRYSSEETGYIAIQCPKHNHLHVVTPATFLEIVDENGAPCPPGVPGKVLVTSMQSYAMPLIRYELGDMAEWGEQCDCGITMPVIRKLWGRTRHLITTPDGTRTYARIYARDFEAVPGLLEYRFVLHQNEIVVAQLRVKEESDKIVEMVTERVHKALAYPYPVAIRYVDKIDWGSSWKQEYFDISNAPATA